MPVFVSVSPIIPAVTDHEIEAILEAAAAAGARAAFSRPVRLPHEVAPLFRAWLDAHHPERAAKVMALIHEMRDGRDNDPEFGSRMVGKGPYAAMLRRRFELTCARLGLANQRLALRCDLFHVPTAQGSLF